MISILKECFYFVYSRSTLWIWRYHQTNLNFIIYRPEIYCACQPSVDLYASHAANDVECDEAVELQRKLEMLNSMLDQEARVEQARKQHQYYIQCECECKLLTFYIPYSIRLTTTFPTHGRMWNLATSFASWQAYILSYFKELIKMVGFGPDKETLFQIRNVETNRRWC